MDCEEIIDLTTDNEDSPENTKMLPYNEGCCSQNGETATEYKNLFGLDDFPCLKFKNDYNDDINSIDFDNVSETETVIAENESLRFPTKRTPVERHIFKTEEENYVEDHSDIASIKDDCDDNSNFLGSINMKSVLLEPLERNNISSAALGCDNLPLAPCKPDKISLVPLKPKPRDLNVINLAPLNPDIYMKRVVIKNEIRSMQELGVQLNLSSYESANRKRRVSSTDGQQIVAEKPLPCKVDTSFHLNHKDYYKKLYFQQNNYDSISQSTNHTGNRNVHITYDNIYTTFSLPLTSGINLHTHFNL